MDNIILAIETSIKAGSLALLNGKRVIDSWTGNNDVSRSEDLLPQISRLLDENQIQLSNLQKIAVSIGPGSFTGIRVGIATAKGLSLALNCRLVGVSILEAVASANNSPKTPKNMVIVSAGRDLYFWQKFYGANAATEAATGNAAVLESELGNGEILLAEQSAYDNLFRANVEFLTKTQVVTDNYAELIGRCAHYKPGKSEDVFPLYIRPAVIIKKGT